MEMLIASALIVQAAALTCLVVEIRRLREDIVTTRIITVPEAIFSSDDPAPNFARKTVVVPLGDEGEK